MVTTVRIPLSSLATRGAPYGSTGKAGREAFLEAAVRTVLADRAERPGVPLVRVEEPDLVLELHPTVDDALTSLVPGLRSREFRDTMPLLESLARRADATASVFYNLGIAHLEQRQWQEAVIRLKRATQLEPTHAPAWVGIGNAYAQLGKDEAARQSFEKALQLDSENSLAQRNLGNLLLKEGKPERAKTHLRRALELAPEEPLCWFSLGQVLVQSSDDDEREEGDELLKRFIDSNPAGDLAEDARVIRTRLAHEGLKKRSLAGFRPDVAMYIAGALNDFKAQGATYRHRLALEISLLGRNGLDIHDPTQKYRLQAKEGRFSGVELLAMMYAAFRQIDATLDVGVDFSAEYAYALSLTDARSAKPPNRAKRQKGSR